MSDHANGNLSDKDKIDRGRHGLLFEYHHFLDAADRGNEGRSLMVEYQQMPRLLRHLAVAAREQDGTGKGALTIRAASLAQAAPDATTRKLNTALLQRQPSK